MNVKGLTATEYALMLGVVSLVLVAGFEAVTNEFTKSVAGGDAEDGIFAKVIAALQAIAANI